MQKHIKVWLDSRGKDGTEPYHNCEKCGSNEGIDVHHIVSRRFENTDVAGNLIMLCRVCHTYAHANNNSAGKAELFDLIKDY